MIDGTGAREPDSERRLDPVKLFRGGPLLDEVRARSAMDHVALAKRTNHPVRR
jgi:hypothetical protein